MSFQERTNENHSKEVLQLFADGSHSIRES